MIQAGVDPLAIPHLNGLTGPGGRPCHGLTIEQRFWLKVDRSGECWLWTGGVSGHGYGRLKNDRGRRPLQLQANRVAWELTQGPIPPGLHVCHSCDTPACVRPAHLFLGTRSDNMRDAVEKGRHRHYAGPGLRGEESPNAILTTADVAEIRSLRARGMTGRAVAKRFGISTAQVSRIRNRQRWAHA